MHPKGHKAWSGRMAEPTHALVDLFTSSLRFDQRLYPYDITGSIAHCAMLAKQRIIPKQQAARIIAALRAIRGEFDAGKFRPVSTDEDIHMAVERRLMEKVGALAGKLHTARSRNDQVALDLRLFLKAEGQRIRVALEKLRRALAQVARRHRDVVVAGYTHLQPAQPVLFAHHLLAYAEMFGRDSGRLEDCL
jgi:argininosuccinate lyase